MTLYMERKVNEALGAETTTTIQHTDVNTFLATLILMLSCIALMLLLYLLLESRRLNDL